MKQTLSMVQEALIQIANQFVIADIVEVHQVPKILNKIGKELKIKISYIPENNSENDINLKKHFDNIDVVRNYLKENSSLSNQEIENKINLLLSFFLPNQKELNEITKTKENPYEFLKVISLLSYYIKKDKNDKNLLWNHKTKFGNLKISINKAKPEKTIESIKQAKNSIPNPNKPKCVICVENVGYSADSFSDSRENLRIKYLDLSDGKWFFQYSPYSYLNNHFVVNNLIHKPMKISNHTLKNLIMFVKENPNYFLGSNADLEIVGGSLLGHDHYQGGEDVLPIMEAKTLKKIEISNSLIEVLNWPLNTVRISSVYENEIFTLGSYFINNWKHFDDQKIVVNNKNNSSTLILNKKNNRYNLYIIFRNNLTTKQRPFGKFHFHHNKFNIKQENIGLMEAAGLAILPQRLENELILIANLIKENKIKNIKDNETLTKHYKWVNNLLKQNKKINKKTIFKFASDVFAKGLEDCKVMEDKIFVKYINDLIVNDEIEIENNTGLKINLLKHGFTFKDLSINGDSYVLRYKDKISYYSNSILVNSFVAPVAGRIEKGILINPFNNDKTTLPVDNSSNFIHSMDYNLSFVNFNFEKIKKDKKFKTLIGYKNIFNEDLNVKYAFKIVLKIPMDKNKIYLQYFIKGNKDFIANPTHHFYFSLPKNENISNYKININKEDKIWYLNKNSNPQTLKKFTLEKEFNSINDISNQLIDEQHKFVGGLIDHPIVSDKKNIILKDDNNQIVLSSKIKSFVLYTHNFPAKEEIICSSKNNKNCGVCIEFQYVPTSIKNPNFEEIFNKANDTYKNNISLKFLTK